MMLPRHGLPAADADHEPLQCADLRGLETSFEFVASISRIFELDMASLNGLSAYAKWQFGLDFKLPKIWLG